MIKTSIRLTLIAMTLVFLGSCARVNLKDGMQAYDELRYQDAIQHLGKGLEKLDDESARRAYAASLYQTHRFAEARVQYEILAATPGFSDADRIHYGRTLMALKQYEDAEAVFNGILSRDPNNKVAQSLSTSSKRAPVMRRDSSLYDVSQVFTDGLTTAYAPFVKDGKVYFSGSKTVVGEKDAYTGLGFTDLYVAPLNGPNMSKPEKVAGVNGSYHDGIATLSPDGSTMVLTRSNYGTGKKLEVNDQSVNTMQLYTSTMSDDGKWSTPVLLPFCKSSNMYAHPSFSPDGKMLYFSSDISDGFGGMDLYSVSFENGTWGAPSNLGASINTSGNEVFPSFRSADSLYFSSNAHQTLGGLDILYSVKRGNSWGEPVQLPYPVNTSFDDFGMAFTNDGTTGFFSSDRSGRDNIYAFIANDNAYSLSGLVTRKYDGTPIEGAKITIQNLTDGTEEVFMSDELGMFENALTGGKDYKIKVEKDGFFAVSENVSTKNNSGDREVKLNLELLDLSNPDDTANTGGDNGSDNGDNTGSGNGDNTGSGDQTGDGKLPKGINANSPYQIPNILWDYNKADIREDARPYLDYVAKLLRDNPGLKVEVSSHADARGSDFYNDELSNRRAQAVSQYLVSKGVKRSMLISRGYGKRKLLNQCSDGVECTEAQHQVNRRTEFKVIN